VSAELELARAFIDLARAATGLSTVTAAPATTTTRGVITSTAPLLARVGIADTATPVTNSATGYTPVVGDVVVVARTGHRQYITGRT
jgi:hypothetical protein